MSAGELSTVILPLSPEGAFRSEPSVDFSHKDDQRAMREALDRVAGLLGHEYELVIGGRRLRTPGKIESINPARPSQIVGIHQKAGTENVAEAMAAALRAYEDWRYVPVEQRSALLLHTAAIFRRRKLEFSAWLVYEVGKNWSEAAADVAEAIDFLEFYAREALRLAAAATPVQLSQERDQLIYLPLGVGAVISPWNFPLAITVGMTSAAIVTGNTVILKPSSDAPTIAALFVQALEEAGLPPGVVNLCPGPGTIFGKAIVEHPQTRFIAFTGSKDAGLEIHLRAAQNVPGQIWIKRTILEMGGKNSIIVSADCDIHSAVDGVVTSAFGFSGQKCSACSRVIVEDAIHDAFLELLQEKVEALDVGDPALNAEMGPVISAAAIQKILSYIALGASEGRLLTGGGRISCADGGFYLQPAVFAGVAPDARIAQEEIFGPVLAVLRARDFAEAIKIANHTEYGLTGAVYSNDRQKLEHARRAFHVGNLYFNRKCTGAMVGAHPFGGFNMSGTDSKAGGPDYLYLFTQAKSIAERL